VRKSTVLVVALGSVLAGCGTTKIVTHTRTVTVTQTVTNTQTTTVAAKAAAKPKPKPPASTASCSASGSIPCVPLGQSQPVQATQESDTMQMTVIGVKDLVPDQFNTPSSGTHFVGVYLTYHNAGSTTFNDSPGNEVTLLTNQQNVVQSSIEELSSCPSTANFTVGSGQTLKTCVAFEEPNGQSVKYVEVSLDSGNDPPVEWAYH
jgi:hypothetical protein